MNIRSLFLLHIGALAPVSFLSVFFGISVLINLLLLAAPASTVFGFESDGQIFPDSNQEYLRELNERADSLLNQNLSDSARVYIEQALELAEELGDSDGESYAVRNLAEYYINRGMPDSIIAEVEPQFEKLAGTEYIMAIGNHIGTAHSMLGNYNRGIEYFSRMLELARERDDVRNMIGIAQNLATTYNTLGDIPSAIEHYMNSLEVAEETDNKQLIAIILDNLASLNSNEGNYELAEQYLNRALEINRSLQNLHHQMTNHMSFGGLYRNMGEYEQALENFERAIEIAEEVGNAIVNVQAIYNLGLLYYRMEELDAAMEMFEQSLELSREQNIPIGAYYNQNGIADVYAARGEYDEAIALYKSSLEIAEGTGGDDLIRTSLKNIYEAFEARGDTASAYGYLKQHFALTDSLSGTQREEALARQEVELGLRAERENRRLLEETIRVEQLNSVIFRILLAVILIALITTIFLYIKKKKANDLLEKRTTELSDVNQMKDRLLSVLAHDLRTPISNMQGVVYMIREKLLEKDEIEQALSSIEIQLEQDVNTLTNYLQWAQNQRDGIYAELQPYPVTELVLNGISKVKDSADKKGILIENNVTEPMYVLADRQMMAVIFRNLLGNAVKYIGSGDKIILDVKKHNGTVELIIQDTGEGIEPEAQKDLFEPFNKRRMEKNGEIGTGLGLSICKDFAKKMGGSLHFKSSREEGTQFTITLQKPSVKESETASL